MPNPLKLYCWNDRPNFGDEVSHVTTAHAAGGQVVKLLKTLPNGETSCGDGILRPKQTLLDHFPGTLKHAASGKKTRKRIENA
ncbi:MAG: hypothetical protein GY952_16805 [Rhodobacteraceae bacterium]|nr:hypothetical protein [Paracoccaceae bacterium]